MLGKTLMLGVISASAALGIVYFGTAPQGSEAAENHPHDGVKAETPNKTLRERIAPRLPTIRNVDASDERKKLASSGGLPETGDVEAEAETAVVSDMPPAAETASAEEPEAPTRWLDQYLKNNKGAEKDEDKAPEKPEETKTASDSAVNTYTVTEREVIEDIEPEDLPKGDAGSGSEDMTKTDSNAVTDPRQFRIVNGKLMEVTPTDGDADDIAVMEEAQEAAEIADKMMKEEKVTTKTFIRTDATNMANDSTPLLSTVMGEAAKIKKAELRDQAYFEITDYALSEGRFDSARMAHDMIEQEELSYTAKSRIAVAYAQNGKPTKAFKVIEDVEEAELRDFMRLQVIEALIAPQNLPETWQEKRH